MLQVYYFTTTGWGATTVSEPTTENTQWGQATVRRALSIDKCISHCQPTEDDPVIITPDPDTAAFRDANGFRLQTVTVPLNYNLTINKSITLAGGAYRLRLDGQTLYSFTHDWTFANKSQTFDDVDFVRMDMGSGVANTYSAVFTRCAFLGCEKQTNKYNYKFLDCVFLNKIVFSNNYGYGFYRCTGYFKNLHSASKQDCIDLTGLTQEQVDAIGFVSPPKALDSDNPGYYADGAEWTEDDWETVDLRLLSTSSYATGNSLTSAGGDVYDLAGNKRSVGGAKGAYEVVPSNVTYVDENKDPVVSFNSPISGTLQVGGWTHITYVDGTVDPSHIVLGLNASATPVYPTTRIFTTTGWNGSGTPVVVDERTLRYLSIDQAIAACKDGYGDVVCEDTESSAFKDAAGFPLQTIPIQMGGDLTISKSLTLRGENSRIRLDGGGLYKQTGGGLLIATDVDFVRLSNAMNIDNYSVFTRCLFAGCKTTGYVVTRYQKPMIELRDCAFIGNLSTITSTAASDTYQYRADTTFRSVGFFINGKASNLNDSINLQNLTQAQVDAIGFVKPPKVGLHKDTDETSATYNEYIYEDGTPWTNSDWESVDLRLKSDSSYASGASSVTSNDTIYDLAGNKRASSGAKGAYEVLDATHYSPTDLDVRWTRGERAADAPELNVAFTAIQPAGSQSFKTVSNGDYVLIEYNNPLNVFTRWTAGNNPSINWTTSNATERTIRVCYCDENETPTSGYAYATLYRNGGAPGNALLCARFGQTGGWRNYLGANTNVAPTNATIYCVDGNCNVESTDATVGEIIVAGWTHADLGDVTGKVVLGKGASVKSSGKLTLENETFQSGELMRRVQLRSPATLRLKNCDVFD